MLPDELGDEVCVPLRIYVAGPLSVEGENGGRVAGAHHVDAADNIARELFARGHWPFCPHTMTERWYEDTRPDFHDYDKIVRGMEVGWLRLCDAIFLLPGWKSSRGSLIEFGAATEMDLWIFKSLVEVPRVKSDDGGRRWLMEFRDDVSRDCRRRLVLGEKKYGDSWKRADCLGEAENELVDWQNWAFLAACKMRYARTQKTG